MNPLESFLDGANIDAVDAMNELQDAGIVSDNAVTAADVAAPDCLTAVKWLMSTEPTHEHANNT